MSLFTNCPLPAALPSQPLQVCPTNIGQIQKIAFWLKGAKPFTTATITTKTAWDAATTATDGTKVVVSNYVNNFAIAPSTAVEQTADTNINAMPELQRGSNPAVTWNSRSLNAAAIKAFKQLTAFSQIQPGVTQLVCCFINQDNVIIYDDNSASGLRQDLGFQAFNLFASDSDVSSTLGALNMISAQMSLKYGWSDRMASAQAAFDLLNTYPAAS